MGKTSISIQGGDFLINDRKVYSDLPGSNTRAHGLLMNARLIQGIFDDKTDPDRFNRFGRTFDPDRNTDDLIKALPQWYLYGLRAFTVGLQGGGPCFTTDNKTIDNNPYGPDGQTLDPDYLARLDRLIRAADDLGMVVIVSFFYPGQLPRLKDEQAVISALKSISGFLKAQRYSNILIEVCNEMDMDKRHPVIHDPSEMARLISMTKQLSGGMPVSCSASGGTSFKEVSQASDFILIHGNGCTRQQFANLIRKVRQESGGKPVICNEDSPALGNLQVAFDQHCSWGYYNSITKQEPPADWSITPGQDQFFAWRMARDIGLAVDEIPESDQYKLMGCDLFLDDRQWIRLDALFPELIDYVEFWLDGQLVDISYDEPFMLNQMTNFFQRSWTPAKSGSHWQAHIHLRDGRVLER